MPGLTRTDERAPRPLRVRPTRRKIVLTGLVLLALTAGWVFRNPLFHRNFGVVDPGRTYRSAQPGAELASTIGRLGIASVLNLRAGSPGDAFYRDELRTTGRLGVDFYDLPLSATRRPSRRELLALIGVLERCRRPLLIHCKSGADRTGLASALDRMLRLGVPPERALSSFSIRYGHVPLFGAGRLHDPIVEYGDWLRARNLVHTAERFRDWVGREYRDDDPPTEAVPEVRPGPRYLVRRRPDQPARAGSQRGAAESGLSASASSRVSTTIDATSQESGISRR
jgi:protein tyrosine phosphatase (PTP) superfamily phosphohydrolase (DUF442 family)